MRQNQRIICGSACTSEHDFDAVLLDLGLDGQTSREIADLLIELKIPFAFVTGYTQPFEPRHASVPLLHKPFTVGQLREVLHALVGPPQLHATRRTIAWLLARHFEADFKQALTRRKSKRGTISSFAPFLAVCRQNWIGCESQNIRGRE